MNSADVLTAILHARENGDDPLLILAEDSPLMDAAREALKPKAPYQLHALDEAVIKFLCWRLPKNFHPDGGISFTYPPESADGHWWPTGTNLFTAEQARNMLEHVVGERIAEQDATIAALREQLEDTSTKLTAEIEENEIYREQLARMPVVVGYVDKNELTIPYLQIGNWSRKQQASYVTPIYIDPQEEPNGSTEAACRKCYGTGKLYTPYKEDNEPTFICPDCKGKKTIAVPSQEPKGCLI